MTDNNIEEIKDQLKRVVILQDNASDLISKVLKNLKEIEKREWVMKR